MHAPVGPVSLPDHWKQVQLVVFAEDNNPHSAALSELADSFADAFRTLGAQTIVLRNCCGQEGVNLFFNSHRIPEDVSATLASNSVIVNLEQLGTILPGMPAYANLLKRLTVWDYSARNIKAAQAMLGRTFTRIHLGFTPAMARIVSVAEPEIDVLFYGSLNPRRQAVLEALRAAGLKVAHLFGAYGAERDAAIANAKVVLNLHYYEDSIHELARTSYLLANKKAVVSEAGPGTEIEDGIREAMVAVPYEEIVEACVALVGDSPRRLQLESAAFELFSRRDQARFLAEAVALTSPSMPAVINLGGGKSWSPDALNIDIAPEGRADLSADISEPGWPGRYFTSNRFGLQRLSAGRFDVIVARDVLQHAPDLTKLMTACLTLLREGGRMEIGVPYDLSYGAWQDPTHVRAFNERSWLYYTAWHWSLGWLEARFDLESVTMIYSPYGAELAKDLPAEDLYRRPRAVDSMEVMLIKRSLSETERAEAERQIAGRNMHNYTNSALEKGDGPAWLSAAMQDMTFPKALLTAQKIMVFLVPERNEMGGGIYSIFSIANQMRRIKNHHGYEVVVMTLPTPQRLTYFRNTNFRNSEDVYRFEQLLLCKYAKDIYLHIPEYAAGFFAAVLSAEEREYLSGRDALHVNVLNQNIKLMPETERFSGLREIAGALSQSVAHHAYFNQEMADKYALPTLFLPAYTDLSEYPPSGFSDKEKFIIYSPDAAPHKQNCLQQISQNLPDFKLIEIRDITFDQFMDYATRCMFSISFGEGFDGYLHQAITQGGIGFAVYNDTFFPSPHLRTYYNIFRNENQMVHDICDRIRYLSTDERAYQQLNNKLQKEYGKLYSYTDYVSQIMKLSVKQFEILPHALKRDLELAIV